MSAAPSIIATLSAACDLSANFGLPGFPCRPKEEMINGELRKAKSPITKHGFKDAVTDLERIEDWWRERPDALVGVPTGASTGLFVVDIDPLAADWYRENAERLACARVHKTLRGHHLLYRMPAVELRNTASKIAPGVDIRAEGGYVIWWPAHGLDAVGDLEDLTPPPQWLVDLQQPAQSASPNADPKNPGEGSRNNTLASLAGKMRRAGASVDEIEIALLVMNGRCNPPLPESEVRQLARGFSRYEQGKTDDPLVRLRSAAEIVATPVSTSWLIRDVFEEYAVGIMFGDLGTFKSFLALDWSFHIASGRPWLEKFKVKEAADVVYIHAEGRGLGKRIRGWCLQHELDVASLKFHAIEHLMDLSSDQGLTNLLAAIDALGIKPKLVAIDTLSRNCGPLDEDKSKDMAPFINRLDMALRVRYGASVLLVHHTGHSAKDRTRGTYVLLANTDSNYRIERPDPEQRIIKITTGRLKDSESPEPIFVMAKVVELGTVDADNKPESTLVLVPTHSRPESKAAKGQPKGAQLEILAAMRARKEPGKIWALEEMRELGRGLGQHKNTARSAVEKLTFTPHMVPTIGGYKLSD